MSYFYGVLHGSREQVTCCGTKKGGLAAYGATCQGAVVLTLWHDKKKGVDCYRVEQIPRLGVGIYQEIGTGIIGQPSWVEEE